MKTPLFRSTCLTKPRLYAAALALALGVNPADATDGGRPLQPHQGDLIAPSVSDFGGVGLLQMPTARMSEDGKIHIGTGAAMPYRRHFITLQAMPWLEATFRYTSVEDRAYSLNSQNQSFKDRGVDLKLRLKKETERSPEIAIGIRDLGGTQLFASEYIVASKRIAQNLDVTGGIAWGNAGTRGHVRNPLGILGESMENREKNVWGTFSSNFFKGERAGLFGGIEYQTPIKSLRVKLEYDGNDYTSDFSTKPHTDTPLNYGIRYSPFDWVSMTAAWERGNTAMLRIALNGSVNDTFTLPKQEPPAPAIIVRPPSDEQAKKTLTPLSDDPFMTGHTVSANAESAGASSSITPSLYGVAYDVLPPVNGVLNVILLAVPSVQTTKALFKAALDLAHGHPAGTVEKVVFHAHVKTPTEVEHKNVTLKIDRIENSLLLTGSVIALMPPLTDDFLSFILENSLYYNEAAKAQKPHSAEDVIFAFLEEEGLDLQDMAIFGTNLVLTVDVGLRPPQENIWEVLVKRLANVRLRGIDSLTVTSFYQGKRLETQTHPLTPRQKTPQTALTAIVNKEDKPEKPQDIPLEPRADDNVSRQTTAETAQAVFKTLTDIQFKGLFFTMQGHSATLYFSQNLYDNPAKAIGRAARAVARHAPPEIEEITLVLEESGLPITKTTIIRSDLEKALLGKGSADEVWLHATHDPAPVFAPEGAVSSKLFPDLSWGLSPKLRQHIGGGDNFYFWQLWLKGSASLRLSRGLSIDGAVGMDLTNNLDELEEDANPSSSLPHVRSETPRYIKKNGMWMDNLSTSYVTTIMPELYGRISAGYLEWMYGGLSAEILYRPIDARWAVGMEVNRVRRRDYDNAFGFLDYNVTTAHVTGYYKWPFYGLDTRLHVGSYLAKDKGFTFEVGRTFESGIRIGAFASKTNISAEEFGEGSFDKGFSISIPLDNYSLKPVRTQGHLLFRPLTRDGAQRVGTPYNLYGLTNNNSLDDIGEGWGDFLD